MTVYKITPMGAVRLSRQDKFAPSKQAKKYFDYGREVRAHGVLLPAVPRLVFTLPMPKSWSVKKKNAMRGQPHQQKPDKDNLEKGLIDAIFYGRDDAHVWASWTEKRWGDEGSIEITPLPDGVSLMIAEISKSFALSSDMRVTTRITQNIGGGFIRGW